MATGNEGRSVIRHVDRTNRAHYGSAIELPGDRYEVAAEMIHPDSLHWRTNSMAWSRERAGVELWSKQRRILNALVTNSRVAVHSCHSAGKTFNAAIATGWWIDVHPRGEAFVVTTAPTGAQVKAVLWREIGKLHTRVGLPGRTNMTEWYLGDELVAYGRKPSEHNEAGFQGIHARYVLVILDEASGIPEQLWVAAETIASNKHSRVLAIGNPDSNEGEFARVCRPGTAWKVIHIGYEHTPNFTGEHVSDDVKDLLISPGWVEQRRRDWGEKSALFQAKCLGQFPDPETDPWKVVPYEMAVKCRYLELPEGSLHEAGIDIGAGGDRTVIQERRGARAGRVHSFRDPDPMKTVGDLVEKINAWGISRVKVDVIGIGHGIYGRIRELSTRHNPSGECTHGAEVVPINFAERSSQPKRFINMRAEVWWSARERSRLGEWDLTEISDDTVAELTEPRYEIMDSFGKIKIESKDEVRKRLGRSPDLADALLLAFWDGSTSGPPDANAVSTYANTGSLIAPGVGGGVSPFRSGTGVTVPSSMPSFVP